MPIANTKALISFADNCEADLRLCFRLCRLLVFSCGGPIIIRHVLYRVFCRGKGILMRIGQGE